MERPPSKDGVAQPARRPLKIFATDPLLRTFGNRARVDVPNESLQPGPIGARLEVIDYDGAQGCFYQQIDLDATPVLLRGGLDPSESDPRFHQQMVYAVAARTLENFDRALGRVLKLGSASRKRGGTFPRLRLFPHAFYGANAFFSPHLNGILFGYFNANSDDPGPNLPGQTVFTCLSHDIIAHEMTHAIVDRLRPLFLEPTNVDVLAFHEAFADIIALFQHFSFPDIVREQIQRTRSDIRTLTPLVELARQFGLATGSGRALRSAIDAPNAKLQSTTTEPHDRGAILVAAVFDGFATSYRRRIDDLIRIATGGTGTLPRGDLHPDLVARISEEAVRTAKRVLDMCIRAFDYMPPLDVTFGDFLRAMVTADFELVPDDTLEIRDAMIEAFRRRGIYAEGVMSLAEESLLWENVEGKLPPLDGELLPLLQKVFFDALQDFDARWQSSDFTGASSAGQSVQEEDGDEFQLDVTNDFVEALARYAQRNLGALGLVAGLKPAVRGFHTVFRVAPTGRLLIELVAQFVQTLPGPRGQIGGVPFRGGCTLVASSNGQVRYLVSKPMGGPLGTPAGEARFKRQEAFVAMCDAQSAMMPYATESERDQRMRALMNFARLHEG